MKTLFVALLAASALYCQTVSQPFPPAGSISLTGIVPPSNPCPIAGQNYTDTVAAKQYFCPTSGGNWQLSSGLANQPFSFLAGATSVAMNHNLGTTNVIPWCINDTTGGQIIVTSITTPLLPNSTTANFSAAANNGHCVVNGSGGVGGVVGTGPYVFSFTGTTASYPSSVTGMGKYPIAFLDDPTSGNRLLGFVYHCLNGSAVAVACSDATSTGNLVIGPVATGTYSGVIYGNTVGFADPLTTNGDLVCRAAGITTRCATIPAATSTYTQTGTPTAGTVAAKLKQVLSVTDPPYSAVGDYTTDDTAAFVAAITAACTVGGNGTNTNSTVLLIPHPTVTYRITATLTIPNNCNLSLQGQGQAEILFVGSGSLFDVQSCLFFSVKGLQLRGILNANTYGIAIKGPIFKVSNSSLVNVVISGGTTASVTTSTAHNIAVGQSITLAGITTAGALNANGGFAVATVPTSTTLTFTIPAATNGTYTDATMALNGGTGVTKLMISENNIINFGDVATKSGAGIRIDADTPGAVIRENIINTAGSPFVVTSFTDTLNFADNYLVSSASRCIDLSNETGAATINIAHNNGACAGGMFRISNSVGGLVNLLWNEFESGLGATNANSAVFEILGGSQTIAIGNTCNPRSLANYCFYEADSVVNSIFEKNEVTNYLANGFRVGSGQPNWHSQNINNGGGVLYNIATANNLSLSSTGALTLAPSGVNQSTTITSNGTGVSAVLSGSTSTAAAVFYGGTAGPGAANANSGQVLLGNLPGVQGRITMDANGGQLVFENSFDNAIAGMAFRLRTSGTFVNMLSMAANGSPVLGNLTVTNPASATTLTIANGSAFMTVGGVATTITSTATTNSTLPAGTHNIAPLDAPVFTVSIAHPTTPFASLGAVPTAGIEVYCTNCTTAATCAGAGTGHIAISNGTNWTCQ